MRLFVIAALAGCYSAPTSSASCTLVCEDSCPGDLQCVNGYCVADGQRCEPTFTRVHAGNGFACALDTLGRLWCWGDNDVHQLDERDESPLVFATLVDSHAWDAIATGGQHICGLLDGALYCRGGNDRQQVSGTISGNVDKLQRVEAPSKAAWTAIAAGYANTCGIADGRLYCWGANNYRQTGAAGTADVGAPSQVGELTDWTHVAIAREHACAVSVSAGLMCWGLDNDGQLGDGSTTFNFTPKPPGPVALAGVTAVAPSGDTTCAIAGGQLYCWGDGSNNALGDPAVVVVPPCVEELSTPTLASTLDGWTHVAASRDHTCAIRTGGELWCWGATPSGVGDGVWASSSFYKVADGVTDVAVGWNSNFDDAGGEGGDLDLTCFIVDGAIRCWGDNRFGQLAQGVASMARVPTEISGGHTWSRLLAGDIHTCGITTAGTPMCWGSNRQGNLDGIVSGTTTTPCTDGVLCATGVPIASQFVARADAMSVGDEHTCVLDGSVLTCWGNNSHSQLGSASATSPAIIAGAWTELLSPGGRGECASMNGATYCWGSVTGYRQPFARDTRFDGAKYIGLTNIIGDVTGAGGAPSHGCVLGATNELSCFGTNQLGQFGDGPPTRVCGNTVCELGETETSCAGDCVGKRTCTMGTCGTTCRAVCNDGFCNGGYGENCSTCAQDCGTCPFTNLGRTYESLAVGWNSNSGFTCGVRPDRQIECWGRNASGQAGALDTNGLVVDPVYVPNVITGLADCSAVSTGGSTACALCGGDIYCWGSHRTGAVGVGPLTAFPITIPRKVDIPLDSGDRWAQLTLGEGYSCARSEAGRGYCWGMHARGALGIGGVSSTVPLPIKTAP